MARACFKLARFNEGDLSAMTDAGVAKAATGIIGLDEITGGGLPAGRPTLVCGSAGCGKTMLAIEFLVRGATQFDEPGVFMMFEESAAELAANVRSLGFDLNALTAQKKLLLDHVHIERSEIEETGEYDLEGLFIRMHELMRSGSPSSSIVSKRFRISSQTIRSCISASRLPRQRWMPKPNDR